MASGHLRSETAPEAEPNPAITWGDVYEDFEAAHRTLGETTLHAAPNVFVGQENARTALDSFIRDAPDGSVALIRGRFGTGKTALVNRVLYDLEYEGLLRSEDIAYEFSNTSDGYVFGQKQGGDPTVVVMEEVGRGATSSYLESTKQALHAGRIKRLIVNGDDTLNDPQFLEAIGITEDQVTRIDIEPLTPDLLKEIIRSRLNFVWRFQQIHHITQVHRGNIPAIIAGLQQMDGAEKYSQEAIDSMFEDEFIKSLAPKTEYPVAEFRGTISLLSQIARNQGLGKHKEPARFDGDTYIQYIEQNGNRVELNSAENQVMQALSDMINAQPEDEPFPALTARELMKKVLGNTYLVDDFMHRIRNLVFFGYLRPFEVSDLDDNSDMPPNARFIPDQKVFLKTKYSPFDEVKTDTQSAEDYQIEGDTPEEKATNLLHSFLYGGINRQTYRKVFARLIREQSSHQTT